MTRLIGIWRIPALPRTFWCLVLLAGVFALAGCQTQQPADRDAETRAVWGDAAKTEPAQQKEDKPKWSLFGGKREDKSVGETWAIRCLSIDGPQRFQKVDYYQELLKQTPVINADTVQVVDAGGRSSLYYGRYKRSTRALGEEVTYSPSPDKDIEYIRELALDLPGGDRIWPFKLATLEALPVGVKEELVKWELNNAPGYYSLQIGVFYNVGEMNQRNAAAEEYCRQLRADGVEAYFMHGPQNSIVTVGSFPQSAIRHRSRVNAFSGEEEQFEKIVDPEMLALQEKYPHHLHNGHKMYDLEFNPETQKKDRIAHTSFPVIIPRESGDDFGGF